MNTGGPELIPSQEPDERSREFSTILDLVTVKFYEAQEMDREDPIYQHVLVDSDIDTLIPLAKHARAPYLEDVLRENRGPLIEIIVPIDDISDPQNARCILTLPDDNPHFLIRNTRATPVEVIEIRQDNFEKLYETVPGATSDEFGQSYFGIISDGEIVPLRKD